MEPLDFAKRIIDFNRLLEGENRDNYDADDIRHWRAVYTDLVRFKEELLGQTRDHIQQVPETRKELAGADIYGLHVGPIPILTGSADQQDRLLDVG